MIEQKIKPILESLAYRGVRPIDRQRCDVADVQVLGALTDILALIAEEQKPLVEALEAAQKEFTAQLKEAGQCDHSVNFCVCPLIKILEQIASALKGVGR